jgi:hypothetical protein
VEQKFCFAQVELVRLANSSRLVSGTSQMSDICTLTTSVSTNLGREVEQIKRNMPALSQRLQRWERIGFTVNLRVLGAADIGILVCHR